MKEKESKKKGTGESRRDFLKTKVFGGMVGMLGMPFLSWGAINNQELSAPKKPPFMQDGTVDWTAVKQQFTLEQGRYHFRTASVGPSPKVVVDTVVDAMRDLESKGQNRHDFIKPVRNKIATFLNTNADQIGMITNTTEGMNIVAQTVKLKAGDEVILSKDEHIGGAAPWLALQKETGIVIKLIELDSLGKKNLDIVKEAITDKTKIVVICHVTCTTGLVLPVRDIAAYCRKKGVLSCVDGAQAMGMIAVDLQEINPDFYVTSGHKWLFGPKGTGLIYVHKEILAKSDPVYAGAYTDSKFNLSTLTLEYKHTADRYEYGTRNTPITLGFGAAIDFMSTIGMQNIEKRGKELARYFKSEISKHPGIELLTPEDEECTAAIVTVRIKGIDVVKRCSHIAYHDNVHMRGIYENDWNGIRLAFAIFNTKEEIDHALQILIREMNNETSNE